MDPQIVKDQADAAALGLNDASKINDIYRSVTEAQLKKAPDADRAKHAALRLDPGMTYDELNGDELVACVDEDPNYFKNMDTQSVIDEIAVIGADFFAAWFEYADRIEAVKSEKAIAAAIAIRKYVTDVASKLGITLIRSSAALKASQKRAVMEQMAAAEAKAMQPDLPFLD